MPNDNQFWDDLYRQVANEPDIPFNEEAWTRMERLLERDRRRIFWFWLFGLSLVLTLGFYWLSASKNQVEPLVNSNTFPIAGIQTTNTTNPATTLSNKHNEAIPKAKSESARFPQVRKRRDVIAGFALTTDFNPGFTPRALSNTTAPIGIDSMAAPASGLRPTNGRAVQITDVHTDQLVQIPAVVSPVTMLDPPIPQPVLYQEPDRLPEKAPIRVHRPARWSVGLELTPAVVSIGFPNPLRASMGVAVIASYRLSKRFAIGLDLQGERVFYLAGKGLYKPGYKFWTRKIAPVATLGDCEMLKSTVTGRFNLWTGGNTTGFVMAGASSWWLLKEQYEYMYTQSDPDLIRYWHSSPNKLQLFGSGGVGYGMERRFGPYWSMQAALYSEIPFTGIGHGHVHIYSTGLLLSILRRF